MILRELYYYDKETLEPVEDKGFDPEYDQSVIKKSDSRKTRLTLRSINRVRKASDKHQEEQTKNLSFVKQMYGIAAQAEAGGV